MVTLPVDARRAAGVRAGDTLRVEVREPGEIVLVREADPIASFAGRLTGLYARDERDALRSEWN